MTELLKIENLSIGYEQRKKKLIVSKSLNTTLKKGELVCLLGANGKGKSTLLKTLCKFIPGINGNIYIGQKSISNISETEMSKKISVVLTERLQVPNATVRELVSYGRSPYTGFMGRLSEKDEKIIDNSIKQCGIDHKTKCLLSSLSDGERQKASIAKALAQDTPVILLDEPTAFLDLPSRVEIMKLLRELAMNAGKSILMSTHDLDLALQMADKLWLIQQEGMLCGSPEDLLYQNAFQSIFNKESISFDNRTGMFRVEYKNRKKFPVKGHGFEYVLLRRAFARKGINIIKPSHINSLWLNIDKESETPFKLYNRKELIAENKSVEKIVNQTLFVLSQQNKEKMGLTVEN